MCQRQDLNPTQTLFKRIHSVTRYDIPCAEYDTAHHCVTQHSLCFPPTQSSHSRTTRPAVFDTGRVGAVSDWKTAVFYGHGAPVSV